MANEVNIIQRLYQAGHYKLVDVILVHLDVKSLCVVPTVCKYWRGIMADPDLWKRLATIRYQCSNHWVRVNMYWFAYWSCENAARGRPMPFDQRKNYLSIHRGLERLQRNWKNPPLTENTIAVKSRMYPGIYCIEFVNEFILTGQGDGTIRIWNRTASKFVAHLGWHRGTVLCLAMSNKGIVFSGSQDSKIFIWSFREKRRINSLKNHGEEVRSLILRNDILMSGSKDRAVVIYDVSQPRSVVILTMIVSHDGPVNCVSLATNYIISGSDDTTIRVWTTTMTTGPYLMHILVGHTKAVKTLSFHKDFLISGSEDCTLRLWDVEVGVCLRSVLAHSDTILSVMMDDKRIISGACDGRIIIWDVEKFKDFDEPITKSRVQTLNVCNPITSVFFDETILVCGTLNDTFKMWEFVDKQQKGFTLFE